MLAISFGLITAGALLADAHDRNATREEVALAGGSSAQSHAFQGDAPGATIMAAPSDIPDEGAPGQSGHGHHACHCAHVHVGWLQDPPELMEELGIRHTGPSPSSDAAPASRRGEPQLRPPIA